MWKSSHFHVDFLCASSKYWNSISASMIVTPNSTVMDKQSEKYLDYSTSATLVEDRNDEFSNTFIQDNNLLNVEFARMCSPPGCFTCHGNQELEAHFATTRFSFEEVADFSVSWSACFSSPRLFTFAGIVKILSNILHWKEGFLFEAGDFSSPFWRVLSCLWRVLQHLGFCLALWLQVQRLGGWAGTL